MHKKLFILTICLFMSGCYIPTNYKIKIYLSRSGNYNISYKGYIVSLGYYQKLRNKLFQSILEENKYYRSIYRDLSIDQNMKDIKYAKDGYFWINWLAKGNILRHHYLAVIRNNNRFATMEYNIKNNQIKITTNPLSSQQMLKLKKIGITIKGDVEFHSNVKIFYNNAQTIEKNKKGWTTYHWHLRSMNEETPLIIIKVKPR